MKVYMKIEKKMCVLMGNSTIECKSFIVEKVFTTEAKAHQRKPHSPIRARCMEFRDSLQAQGYERLLLLTRWRNSKLSPE